MRGEGGAGEGVTKGVEASDIWRDQTCFLIAGYLKPHITQLATSGSRLSTLDTNYISFSSISF